MHVGKILSKIIGLIFFFIFLCWVIGCAGIVVSNTTIDTSPNDKIPIRIGLYMKPSFISYINPSEYVKVKLTDGMSKNALENLRLIFQDIVRVDMNGTTDKSIKYIMTAEILDDYLNNIPFSTKYGVICKWTVATTSGKVLYVNTIEGEGSDNSFVGNTRISNAMTKAVKDQYEKLAKSLRSSSWWQQVK